MSHYAKVENGLVTQVIVAEADVLHLFPGTWVQTSYNTRGNVHSLGGTALRANYAGIGHIYDAEHDVFYAPQPSPEHTLNTTTWLWELPTQGNI
jgi:hypothetical protein